MKKVFLIIVAMLSFNSFAAGAFEQVFDDVIETLEQVKEQNAEMCAERKFNALMNLASFVNQYASKEMTANDLRLQMGLLHTSVVAQDVFCILPDSLFLIFLAVTEGGKNWGSCGLSYPFQ